MTALEFVWFGLCFLVLWIACCGLIAIAWKIAANWWEQRKMRRDRHRKYRREAKDADAV